MKKLVLFDALHTGSHKAWSRGLAEALFECGWNVRVVELPGRHWKWRMQGAAWWFADRVVREGWPSPDAVLVTDMVDVARLRGCLPMSWRRVPVLAYFHENQLTFPWKDDERAHQQTGYAFINILAAWAADAVWFNSAHHRDAFLQALPEWLHRMPDAVPTGGAARIAERPAILAPGLDLPTVPEPTLLRPIQAPPTLIWNHRWAYDKHPEFFVQALERLRESQIPFNLDLMGAGDRSESGPLQDLLHSGRCTVLNAEPAQNSSEYWSRLMNADILIHNPLQEYFGISVVEALHAGVLPLLPDAHAYPEYAGGFRAVRTPEQVASGMQAILKAPAAAVRQWRVQAHEAAARFHWTRMGPLYAKALDACVKESRPQ
jgi:glycosyltransferase involved in cell wall biosynthesis